MVEAVTAKLTNWPTVLATPAGWESMVGATAGELVNADALMPSSECLSFSSDRAEIET